MSPDYGVNDVSGRSQAARVMELVGNGERRVEFLWVMNDKELKA